MSYANTTLKEAINLSINNDKKLNQFCEDSVQTLDNTRSKYLLQNLSNFERNHLKQLKSLREKLLLEVNSIAEKNADDPDAPRASTNPQRDKAVLLELLKMTTDTEKKATEAFSKVKSHVEDVQWKKEFNKLIEEEHLQTRLLHDELYDFSNNKGVWHWGD